MALVLAACLGGLAAGCASSGSSAQTGVPVLQRVANLEKTTLNVSALANGDSAGFFVALHEGLFAQEGLQVNYTPAFSDNVIAEQMEGKLDITGIDYVSYIEAELHHTADLRIFAEGARLRPGSQVIMTMPGSRIQSLPELKGHVLGVTAGSNLNVGYLLVAALLAQNGISMKVTSAYSPNSVVLPTSPNFPFPASKPLIRGQVSAAIMSEPYATELAEQYGATIISDTDSGATNDLPITGYAVSKAWARANPNTLKAFDIALEAGQDIADSNRSAVEEALEALPAGAGKVSNLVASTMALDYFPLGVSRIDLQRILDFMQEFGFLKQNFNIGQMLS